MHNQQKTKINYTHLSPDIKQKKKQLTGQVVAMAKLYGEKSLTFREQLSHWGCHLRHSAAGDRLGGL